MNSIYNLLSKASNLDDIKQNDKIEIMVDIMLAHDGSMSKIIDVYEKLNSNIPGINFSKLHVTVDHFLPSPTTKDRSFFLKLKDFSKIHGINLYHQGEGILHQVIAEKFGESLKDKIIVGVDGHMCTSAGMGALAFSITPDEMIDVLINGKYQLIVPEVITIKLFGDDLQNHSGRDIAYYLTSKIGKKLIKSKGILIYEGSKSNLSNSQKMTIGNILGEVGAKTVYFEEEVNDICDFELNLSDVIPLVMEPITEDIKGITDINEENITQVYIGGCTNGRIDDMKDISDILKDNKISEDLTLIVCPASRNIANEMDELGYSKIIRDSGGIIINPGCGACSGIHQGVINKDDIIVSTTPRNSSGRMGDKDGRIYLSSPKVAAKIALKGKIN